MGSNRHSLAWMIFVLVASVRSCQGQGIKSTRLLDLLIRDYTFKSFNKHFKTGTPYSIHLPSNLSGITVYTSRYRCGSLKRYGATINQFYLKVGVYVHPCIQRILIVTQNLGNNWSSIYYDDALLGYELVSPVLGLLAYNSGDHTQSFLQSPEEAGIQVNFTSSTLDAAAGGRIKMCATFQGDGSVKLQKEVAPNVCGAMSQGHFGLVVQSPLLPVRNKKMQRRWTVAFGCSVGAAIAVFLVGLLLIAMFVRVKKKAAARVEEMERRAYEEEALEVSMAGIRVHTTTTSRR